MKIYVNLYLKYFTACKDHVFIFYIIIISHIKYN